MPRGRPKGGKNKKYSLDYKLMIVKRHIENYESLNDISKDENISDGLIANWCKAYNEGGVDGLKTKKKGNPFAALHTSKSLSKEERLELENLKLRIENERLKKGYTVKGGGVNKEYVSILDVNTKSSKS